MKARELAKLVTSRSKDARCLQSVGHSYTIKNCPMPCITFTASQDIYEGELVYNYQKPRTYKNKVFSPVLTYPEFSKKTVFCLC